MQAVCIDLCSIYAAAVRRTLAHATLTADLFHVVQLAVKAVGDVRRRVVRVRYGRRGRSGDPEYGIKGLLVRNLEHLSPAQFTKVIDTLSREYGQEIAVAWIAKRKAPRRAEPAKMSRILACCANDEDCGRPMIHQCPCGFATNDQLWFESQSGTASSQR